METSVRLRGTVSVSVDRAALLGRFQQDGFVLDRKRRRVFTILEEKVWLVKGSL
jgi:hypothetical protein